MALQEMQSAGQSINTIVIVESLRDELHTGKKLSEGSLVQICTQRGGGPTFLEVRTKDSLFATLLELSERAAKNGTRPVLHIEAHGCPLGLSLSGEREPIPWSELAPSLRSINHAAANNVLLVLACCHGRDSLTGFFDILKPSPFCTAIACDAEVTAGQIEKFNAFYAHLFNSFAPHEAAAKTLPNFRFYSAEAFFVEFWVRLLVEVSRGRVRQAMLEEQVSRQRLLTRNELSLGDLRGLIRPQLSVDSDHYRRSFYAMRSIFLVADHPENTGRFSIDFDAVLVKALDRKNRLQAPSGVKR